VCVFVCVCVCVSVCLCVRWHSDAGKPLWRGGSQSVAGTPGPGLLHSGPEVSGRLACVCVCVRVCVHVRWYSDAGKPCRWGGSVNLSRPVFLQGGPTFFQGGPSRGRSRIFLRVVPHEGGPVTLSA
jgi:hypothetical protein